MQIYLLNKSETNSFHPSLQFKKTGKLYSARIDLCHRALALKDGDNYKKVAGGWYRSYREGWITYGILLCFKPNFEVMKPVFRTDSGKMKIWGATNIENVVGGVGESLDKNKIVKEISQGIADRFGMSLEEGELTEEEASKMSEVAQKLNNDGWNLYAKRPKFE